MELQQLWDFFGEFIFLKQCVGEPSPHMQLVGYMSQNKDWSTRVWRIGCYAAPYNIITAEALWESWPTAESVIANPKGLEDWLVQHWAGLYAATERRMVRSPSRLARCLLSYAEWSLFKYPEMHRKVSELDDPRVRYDTIWASAQDIYFMGRYILIRVLESLRRYCGLQAELYDVRSIGGWSPKKMLASLRPDAAADILNPSGPVSDRVTDIVSEEVLSRLRSDYGLDISYYVYAAMLCEFREVVERRAQYPGRTHDEELTYYSRFRPYWEQYFPSQFLSARKEIFPLECLGELNGWSAFRKLLGGTVLDHGYNWCDLIYHYYGEEAAANPKRREPSLELKVRMR